MEILNIKNLTFKYPSGEKNALENVSLSVNDGDFILICGSSGSGKTTLLRLLKKELAPYGEMSGEIFVEENKMVGIVTQDTDNQIVSDTVWHNLAFGLESMNKTPDEIRRKVAEIAEFFDIVHMFKKSTFELSGGEKQILNLASVMVTDPDILILDEPTSQLDPIAARNFIDIVKRLNEEMNLTVIISEHRCEDLWSFANRVCLMDKGNIISQITENRDYTRISFNHVELPKGVQLFNRLNFKGPCPITVGECRRFLSENFKYNIDRLEDKSSQREIALKIKNISFRYEKHGKDILKNLNFTCHFGEITTLLGGNGTGKSTLLSLLGGINKPYSGKITIKEKIAVLPQNIKAVFTKDVLKDDFALISENYTEICKQLDIEHLLNRNPYDLSGGEAQRAALAKILLVNPNIICLDEPTKGIDAKGKRDIQKILKELSDRGVCVILVSHDADFSAEVSDKCAFLFDGQIVSEGTPREVFSSNKFYTTFASRISRHMYKNAVTIDDIVELCKRND